KRRSARAISSLFSAWSRGSRLIASRAANRACNTGLAQPGPIAEDAPFHHSGRERFRRHLNRAVDAIGEPDICHRRLVADAHDLEAGEPTDIEADLALVIMK